MPCRIDEGYANLITPDTAALPLQHCCKWLVAGVCMITAAGGAAANDEPGTRQGRSIAVVEGDILTDKLITDRAVATPTATNLWSFGIVPYTIDPQLSMAEVLIIREAIDHWNAVSGVSLKPLDAVQTANQPVLDSVEFVPGDVCASWVGRRGGKQSLWVAPNCNSGSIVHEIGHVLGLEHEHTRPDRGNHIDIHWENIDPAKRHNFNVAPPSSRMLGTYDFDSIMHYGPTTFSINGQPTISPIDRSVSGIGQRLALSPGDLEGIAELYGSDLSVVANQFPGDDQSEVEIHVTNEYSQGAHDIELLISLHNGSQLQVDPGERWVCNKPELLQSGQEQSNEITQYQGLFDQAILYQSQLNEEQINLEPPSQGLTNQEQLNPELLNQGLMNPGLQQAQITRPPINQSDVEKEEISEETTSDVQLSCKLDRLTAGGSAVMRLSNYALTVDETVNAVVKSKTPDIDLTNNTTDAQDGQVAIDFEQRPLLNTSLPIQQDAVAQVSLAGMVNPYWLFLLLLLNVRQRFRRSF